jgi:hypothetical protein
MANRSNTTSIEKIESKFGGVLQGPMGSELFCGTTPETTHVIRSSWDAFNACQQSGTMAAAL